MAKKKSIVPSQQEILTWSTPQLRANCEACIEIAFYRLETYRICRVEYEEAVKALVLMKAEINRRAKEGHTSS